MMPLSDGERVADADNPRGYLEWERIKTLPKGPGCIAEAEGKVVKVISRLLLSLPAGYDYRVIFMLRPLPEVLASQEEMMRRRGTFKEGASPAAMAAAFEKHLREVYGWLDRTPYVRSMRVSHHEALEDPRAMSGKIGEFLVVRLEVAAMAQQVDASLYRNRG